jgi:hypothetical protein
MKVNREKSADSSLLLLLSTPNVSQPSIQSNKAENWNHSLPSSSCSSSSPPFSSFLVAFAKVEAPATLLFVQGPRDATQAHPKSRFVIFRHQIPPLYTVFAFALGAVVTRMVVAEKAAEDGAERRVEERAERRGGAEERMSELAGVWCLTTTHTATLSDALPLHAMRYNQICGLSFVMIAQGGSHEGRQLEV